MKRIITILLTISMVMLLSGCTRKSMSDMAEPDAILDAAEAQLDELLGISSELDFVIPGGWYDDEEGIQRAGGKKLSGTDYTIFEGIENQKFENVEWKYTYEEVNNVGARKDYLLLIYTLGEDQYHVTFQGLASSSDMSHHLLYINGTDQGSAIKDEWVRDVFPSRDEDEEDETEVETEEKSEEKESEETVEEVTNESTESNKSASQNIWKEIHTEWTTGSDYPMLELSITTVSDEHITFILSGVASSGSTGYIDGSATIQSDGSAKYLGTDGHIITFTTDGSFIKVTETDAPIGIYGVGFTTFNGQYSEKHDNAG